MDASAHMAHLTRDEWAKAVLFTANGSCDSCGSAVDVRACYITPPSLGGRNDSQNGVALCGSCRSTRAGSRNRVRITVSLDESLAEDLQKRAELDGRSVSEILRQLASENIASLPSPVYPNGKPSARVSAWLAQDVFEELLGAVGHRSRIGGVLASLVRSWIDSRTSVGQPNEEKS